MPSTKNNLLLKTADVPEGVCGVRLNEGSIAHLDTFVLVEIWRGAS